jgi:mannose/cellobiose epimerase-like protein (N-acyl-D-glucosamine 2-epimerase family)
MVAPCEGLVTGVTCHGHGTEWARLLGDVEAIRQPHKIPKRAVNKLVGRGVVRRLWR